MADPELYQTVFARPIEEIEDGRLQQHLYDQKFWVDDEEGLRENGFEHFASQIRDEKFDLNRINKEIEASRQRQELQRQKAEAWKNMSLAEKWLLNLYQWDK